MLTITITVDTDDAELLDIVVQAAQTLGYGCVRKFRLVEVTLSETHELEKFAVTVHSQALQAG